MNGGGRGRGRGKVRGRGGADPNANILPPPPPPQFNVAQLMAMQTQILQGMAATLANLQAQKNQPPPPPPPQPMVKHREFMSHRPPTYSHPADPLQADDWLKVVEKMLNITQCNDREKVCMLPTDLRDLQLIGGICTCQSCHHHLVRVQGSLQISSYPS